MARNGTSPLIIHKIYWEHYHKWLMRSNPIFSAALNSRKERMIPELPRWFEKRMNARASYCFPWCWLSALNYSQRQPRLLSDQPLAAERSSFVDHNLILARFKGGILTGRRRDGRNCYHNLFVLSWFFITLKWLMKGWEWVILGFEVCGKEELFEMWLESGLVRYFFCWIGIVWYF